MNRKGFTLIELLGGLAILGAVLCVGLFVTGDTLATSLSTLTNVSTNQIKEASQLYILEHKMTWINNGEEYTCLTVKNLVDAGYFDTDEVSKYKNDEIKIIRNPLTRVINEVKIVDVCK